MSTKHTIGNISFSEKGYESFVVKTKEEQIEKVLNSHSYMSRKEAENLLKNIPHGNISKGNEKEVIENNSGNDTGRSRRHNSNGQKPKDRKGE